MISKVVVIGRNYSSRLGMIRAAGSIGCSVKVVVCVRKLKPCMERPIDCYSKFVSSYYFATEPDHQSVINVLIEKCKDELDQQVLLPTDDFAASSIDLYQDLLSKYYKFPHIQHRQGAIVEMMDKKIQKEIACSVGLNVVKSWVLSLQNGEYLLPKDLSYPCFPKPMISFLGDKTCMKRCDNEYELRSVLETIPRQIQCPIIVEEYHAIDKEYAILGFCDANNVIIPTAIEMLIDGTGPHKGVTLQGRILSNYSDEDLMSKLSSFIKRIKLTGLFDIDTFESNGKLYFNELNLRYGASGYALTRVGINLPSLLIISLSGKQQYSAGNIDSDYVFFNEKVAFEDYRNGFISKDQYNKIMSASDFSFLRLENDMEPYNVFMHRNFGILKRAKRYLKKCLKLK